ncbi:PREDICTED: mevalonate kinase [Papilio polytes]|uniref:mevalonate kinase n=1 Tax=Papilio polytes TaxID=76194 RepID=UPI000675EA18|nr:PREDICTED: mevalonate kinase [Papilio polytes]XP_013144695.1 PREDICTED: mevalonate kinase [Papilio polytes]
MEGIEVSSPGKIILHGEHSVMYGKTALAVSLGLRSTVVLKELPATENPKMHVKFPNVQLNEILPLKPIAEHLFPGQPVRVDHDVYMNKINNLLNEIRPGFEELHNTQKNSLRALLYSLAGIYGTANLDVMDFSLEMNTELTVGAGTGSSASFATCLCGVFVKLVQMKTIGKVLEFNEDEKKLVSGWAYKCERITHGTPSGVDNTTCTFGALVSFRKGEVPTLCASPELRVLLVDSGVARETSRLIEAVAALRVTNTNAVDHIMDAMDNVAISAAQLLNNLSQTESQEEVVSIYKHLNELWEMNHCLLASLGVSHPALEEIRGAARSRHLPCKLTGAGGGGNAIVLIPPYTEETAVTSLKTQLQENGFKVTDTVVGGPGVCVKI